MFGRFGNIEEPYSGSLIDLEKSEYSKVLLFEEATKYLTYDMKIVDKMA